MRIFAGQGCYDPNAGQRVVILHPTHHLRLPRHSFHRRRYFVVGRIFDQHRLVSDDG